MLDQTLNSLLGITDYIHSYLSLLYTGCHCTICISHPSGTPWWKERIKERPSREYCYPEYPLCIETAHISQGLKRGLQIGYEGSQMTSRPQFPPCGIKKNCQQLFWITVPFENLLAMDHQSRNMHIPTNYTQFRESGKSPTPTQGS